MYSGRPASSHTMAYDWTEYVDLTARETHSIHPLAARYTSECDTDVLISIIFTSLRPDTYIVYKELRGASELYPLSSLGHAAEQNGKQNVSEDS